MDRPTSLVISDDRPLLLGGLELIFGDSGEFDVLECCTGASATVAAVGIHRPDVLIVGAVAALSALDVIREVRARHAHVLVVMLAEAADERVMRQALALRAHCVIAQNLSPEAFRRYVRRVCSGGQLAAAGSRREGMPSRDCGAFVAARLLTRREAELVRYVAEGLRNKEIAERLGIAEQTVKAHVHHIYKKLGVSTRVALRRYAEDWGLLLGGRNGW